MKNFLLLIVIYCCSFASLSDSITNLNPIESLKITSERFPESITFNVTLPEGYRENSDKKYIVLLDFHPRSQPFLSGMHDWMGHNGEWPWLDTIIVTNSGVFNPRLKEIHEQAIAGENEDLLNFIEHDLIQAINKKYRTNGFRIFSGFTSNASLSIYTLLNRPHLFHAYIAASPILIDDHLAILSQAKTKLAALNKPRYLFLSTGNSGYEKAQQSSFKQLAQILKENNNQHLTYNIKRFDDAYYMTQPILATAHAIEDIFKDINEDLPADSAIAKQGAQAIIDHYQYLSKDKFGFNVSALSSLRALGFAQLESHPQQAITTLKLAVKEYPESAFSYAALAKAYFKLEKFEQAVNTQEIAVEKSQSLIPWHQRKQQQYLDEYKAKLVK